jgi:hypothetical protein
MEPTLEDGKDSLIVLLLKFFLWHLRHVDNLVDAQICNREFELLYYYRLK